MEGHYPAGQQGGAGGTDRMQVQASTDDHR